MKPYREEYKPGQVETCALYRVYLFSDDDQNYLLERPLKIHTEGTPVGTSDRMAYGLSYASDPLGLAKDGQCVLPGFSLTAPLSDEAKAMEDLWATRRAKHFFNESNEFDERILVRAPVNGGEHQYLDWVEIRARVYLYDRLDEIPLCPRDGFEWLQADAENLLSGHDVGGHYRNVLSLFSDFMRDYGGPIF